MNQRLIGSIELTILIALIFFIFRFFWIRRLTLKKWFIIIFAPPGQGKSIEGAKLSYKLINEYYRLEKVYKKLYAKNIIRKRYLFTNQFLTENIRYRVFRWKNKKLFTDAITDGHLRYWTTPNELKFCPIKECWKSTKLHPLHDCDIFCDEGMKIFPATAKGGADDLELWQKDLIILHRHRGIRIVLFTQDFMGINITARRCAWEAWAMEKKWGSRDPSPSLPPIRWIWGFYVTRKIDPDLARQDAADVRLMIKVEDQKTSEEKENIKMQLVGAPRLHWISRFKVSLYDTTQEVQSKNREYEVRHIWVRCDDPKCFKMHEKVVWQ